MALDTGNYAIITKGRGDTQTVSYPPDTTYGYLNSTIDAIPGLRDVVNAGGKGMQTQLQNAMSDPAQFAERNLLGGLADNSQSKISDNVQFLQSQGKDLPTIQNDLNVLNQESQTGSGGFLGQVTSILTNPTALASLAAAYFIPGAAEALAPTIAGALGTSVAAGQLIAAGTLSAATQVASGVPVDKAIENAGISTLAPVVGNEVGNAAGIPSVLNSTNGAVGSTLTDLGLNAPSATAVNNAVGSTLLNTGVALATNQDPTKILNAGVGSLVGSTVGANVGTDSNLINKAIGSAAGAATTAGLNNTDATTAVENSLISSTLNAAGQAIKGAVSSGSTTDTTPSTNTATTSPVTTSSSGNPTPLPPLSVDTKPPVDTSVVTAPVVSYVENGNGFDTQGNNLGTVSTLGLIPGTDSNNNTIYVDAGGNTIPTVQTNAVQAPGSTQATNLPPDSSGTPTTTTGTPATTGNTTETNIAPITTGTTTGTTTETNTAPTGTEVNKTEATTGTNTTGIPGATSTTPSIDAAVDNTGMATFKGDGQPGDYPTQIITNSDGSVTTVENNGTSLTFNTDGTIVQSHEDGSTSNPLSTELPPGVYPDGNGGFTNILGYPVTSTGESLTYDANGNLLDSNGNVYQYTPPYENNTDTIIKPSGSGTIGGIGTIGTKGGGGGGSGSGGSGGAGAVTGLGALAAGLLGSKTGGAPDFGLQSIGQGNFSWNSNAVNAPENGVAYGQQILNPTYTPSAKEGGMVKHLDSGGQVIIGANSNFTQLPTIGPNGLLPASYGVSPYTSTVAQNGINVAPAPNAFKQGGAVHREIYNALKQAGHPIDGDTISKIAHLNEIGAPAHHIVGFLNHQRMSSGGPLGAYSDGGHFLKGPGDGMSDDIPARIGGHQEARLANEEFVIPADVVSHLGNGSSEAGAKVLYKMMDKIRHARTGTTKQGKQINPDKFMPT